MGYTPYFLYFFIQGMGYTPYFLVNFKKKK